LKIPGIKRAKQLAKRSNRHQSHVAIVFRGGALLSMAFNKDKVHAEFSALSKLWPSKRKGVTLISLRVGRDDQFKNAEPCAKCWAFIKASGVKRVMWSSKTGELA